MKFCGLIFTTIVLNAVFFVACADIYDEEQLNSEFKIRGFQNAYSQNAKETDSLFSVLDDAGFWEVATLGFKNNTDILIYENRIKIAQAQSKIATSKQMPNASGSISYDYKGNSTINTNLMVSWELDIFAKYANAKNASLEQLKMANENLAFFKISLLSDLALAYYNAKYLQSNVEITRERIKNYYELVALMDSMYKDGFVDFADFLETKAFLQQEEQSLNTLLTSYEEQKNALRVLLNDMNYEIDDSVFTRGFGDKNFSVNLDDSVNIILNRPDIKAQVANLNAAVYNLASAKADMYPSINLSGSLGSALLSPAGVGQLAYDILASLTLPLFSRMEIYENIKISDYTRLEAYYTLQKGIHTALSEIENAIYALESNRKMLKISKEMLRENEEILEVLKHSKDLGLVDMVEYLNAINSNLLMIKNNNTMEFNTLSAIVYLYRSVGGSPSDNL